MIDKGDKPRSKTRYKYVFVNGKTVLEHVHVWEQANGPKPEGCDIHHIDGDGQNNALENLVCLTKSEHKQLHAKAKLAGKDIVDGADPVIAADRARKNALAKTQREYYEQHQEQVHAFRQAYKQVHAVSERYRRAIRNGASEEVITKLKNDLDQAKELFRQQKEGTK